MEIETIENLKIIIRNITNISKEKELQIEDLKDKLKKERYIKRFNNKKFKRLEYENMILRNKLNTLKITENKNINDYPNVYNISFQ
jgi:hypothetical protein